MKRIDSIIGDQILHRLHAGKLFILLAVIIILSTTTLMYAESSDAQVATGSVLVAGQGDPIENVIVSDGYSFTQTDQDGRFELKLHAAARWVTLINPSGYKPISAMHQLRPEDSSADLTADFELAPLEHSPDESFTFVYLSDVHLGSEYRSSRVRNEFIEAINRIPDQPRFIMETGDLSLDTVDRMEIARQNSLRYKMPHLPSIGNHDRPDAGPHRAYTYERLFSPVYYAFTYHNYLFIALPWGDDVVEAYEWSKTLLEKIGSDHHVVAYMHHWDGVRAKHNEFASLFKEHNVVGVFMGHYHMNRMTEHDGIASYMTTSGTPYIRDFTRPAFNIVTAHPTGDIEIEQRPVGHARDLSLISPATDGKLFRELAQSILVNAYDTSTPVRTVRASVFDAGVAGNKLHTVSLTQENAYLWRAEIHPDAAWPETVFLTIDVEDEAGHAWPSVNTLRSVADASARPTPQLDRMADFLPKHGEAPPIEVAWAYSVGGSFGVSAPVVYDDVVYVGVEQFTEVDRVNPVLVAVDAVTGSERWQYAMKGGSIRTTPSVSNGLVVAQADDGRVVVLDRERGQLQWIDQGMVSTGPSSQVFHRSSPALLGDGDIIAGGGPIYSRLNLDSGEPVWRHVDRSGWRGWGPPSPVVAGDRVLASIDNILQAIDAASGDIQWETSFEGALGGTPVVVDETVYLLARHAGRWEPHQAVAINLEDGDILWHTDLQHRGKSFSPPVVADGIMYAIDYDSVVAIDAATGQIRWRESFARGLSESDYLMSRDLTSGAHLENSLYGLVTGTPAAVNGQLFFVTRTGRLIAFDLKNKQYAWSYDLGTSVDAGPAVAGNMIYVAGRNGVLYAMVKRGE
ncbi:PQQ-binding-like beta-propeller repeat protein [Phycisphaerales bacterium AB-hyl4]|uniref:PQQ-binding-like beta-propeller repeat protein n=1 Tax=Natronomicrosphaera hydrolytica TaxID=3242702 RepID=A0ABV4UAZ8_9BACT